MSFTKITNAGFGLTTGTLVGVAASFSSTVSVGGTLTYEDVTNVDSVGLITARNGIEVTDKGVQVGTGATVDSAASNTLSFLTGGSERLRIDSNGKLILTPGADSGNIIQLNGADATSEILELGINATGNVQLTATHASGGSNTCGFIFRTRGGSGGTTEKLRITSAGSVGIGTTNPGRALQISQANSTAYSGTDFDQDYHVLKLNNFTDSKTVGMQFLIGSNGEAAITATEANDGATDLIFGTRGSGSRAERLRITSGGNIGIGTISPLRALQVGSHGSGNGEIALASADDGNCSILMGDGATGTDFYRGYIQYQNSADSLVFATSTAARLRIDSSGRVLVGTTSTYDNEASNLVVASSSHTGITVASTGSDKRTNLYFADGTSSTAPYVGGFTYDHAGDHLLTRTNGSERMRIDSSGRVLLGTTSNYADGGADNLVVGSTSTGEQGITIGAQTSSQIRFADAGNNTAGYISFTHSEDVLVFGVPSERMRIDNSGRVLIGTTTEGYAGAETFTVASSGNAGITIRTGTTSNGTIAFSDATSGTDEYDGYIQYRHASQDLVLATDAQQRARFSSGGAFLLVPNTNVDTIYSSVASSGTSAAVFRGLHSATVGTPGSGTDSIFIFANGNIQNTNNSYGQISDIKLKENIVDAGSQWSDFKSVRFRKYNFKSETGHETNTQLGVVAQELELTSPGLVYETVDRDIDGNDLGTKTKGVKSSILTMKALVALQEAMARIETLETQNADLLSRVTALEG